MKNKTRCYILIGEEQNWIVSLEKKLWGFNNRTKGLWNTTKKGDFLTFYVTKPVQRIIGFGIVRDKFFDDALIWNDEKLFRRSLWPYKISFDIFHKCKIWEKGVTIPKNMFLQVSRKVVSNTFYTNLIKKADSEWNTNIQKMIVLHLNSQHQNTN